jgi:multidrug efflux pump subunit AcrA (membrane-fusion protein)
VLALEPAIDAPTRSLLVRGVYENPAALLPGAFVTVEVPVEQRGAGILVPAHAIVPSVSGHAVYVLERPRRAAPGRDRPAHAGVGRDPQGLGVGETVLTSNLPRMRRERASSLSGSG